MSGPQVLTIAERRAVALVSVICLEWPMTRDVSTLIALLGEVQPQIRRTFALDDLSIAARGLTLARGSAEFSRAVDQARSALIRVQRADIVESFAAERGGLRQAG